MPSGVHTGSQVSPERRRIFFVAIDEGLTRRAACKIAGIGHSTAQRLVDQRRARGVSSGRVAPARVASAHPPPLVDSGPSSVERAPDVRSASPLPPGRPPMPSRDDTRDIYTATVYSANRVPLAKRAAYFAALDRGITRRLACKEAGIGHTTGQRLEDLRRAGELKPPPPPGPWARRRSPLPPGPTPDFGTDTENGTGGFSYGPIPYDELSAEARKGLEDFGYFRRRYLGRGASEWQVEAATQMLQLLHTGRREYVVVSAPPGVGKSSLFVHDLPAWLICQDRRIRILIGSRTERQADRYANRLRDTLGRSHVARPPDLQIRRGLAVVPEASLSGDYGRFRGLERELWTRGAFTVAQERAYVSTEKENTVTAFGQDSGVLGMRFDFCVWDDLVDSSNVRTPYARETLIDWWERESEQRLDPDAAGLLVLQGQRIDPSDLYRHALDQQAFDDEGESTKKYHHIVFPAHFEDRCRGDHALGAPSYPEGCLLDSHRLPWRELAAHQLNNPDRYQVLFQQDDADPANAMVQRLWIGGGRDTKTGEVFPGCWDHGRGLATLPDDLVAPIHSVCVADPAPSRYWAIQHWLFEPATERRYLIDLVRTQMTASAFLDWNQREGTFTGLMEDWWVRAQALGIPITHWIVEANAAQKFMLQYDHVTRWSQTRGVSLIPHSTQAVNKLDQSIGVTSIGPHYRFGRVRLPAGDGPLSPAASASLRLVNEAVGWDSYATDDCVLAQWFLEVQIPNLFTTRKPRQPAQRPSWLR